MPGETKIKQTRIGWVDLDNPTVGYKTRELARVARKARRMGKPMPPSISWPSSTPASTSSPAPAPVNNTPANVAQSATPLTSLQQRLYDRLTTQQGVDDVDALAVILSNRYNKAASYGHMRAAGATHFEAWIVINLDSPEVSLRYGKFRSDGFNHTDALQRALRGTQGVDAD